MKCLILAGGSGTRLWPLSRTDYPKQFLRLGENESLLQKTVRRNLHLAAPEDLYVLTHASYQEEVKRQLEVIHPVLKQNILLEPASKNTAPALAFAFAQLKPDNQTLFLITPSDHLINPVEKYCEAIEKGKKEALKGQLVTFGVPPTHPDTGFGYLQIEEGRVKRFIEKPSLEKAATYLQEGGYLWNAGLFLFSYGAFWLAAKKHAPALIERPFSEMPSISLDYAIMEKAQNVSCIPLHLSWSDIGSWDKVYAMGEKDARGNVVQGKVIAKQTSHSLLHSQNRLVSVIGLENVVVVETEDAVLVCSQERAQEVKDLVEILKAENFPEAHTHRKVERPWGSYTVLKEGERHKIKRIYVKPKEKLSLQMHYHRSEHWVVVSGTARVTIGEEESIVHEGESVFVPKSSLHRMENPGKVPLEIIEVQVGEYLGEDDIIRFDDVYGRMQTTSLS